MTRLRLLLMLLTLVGVLGVPLGLNAQSDKYDRDKSFIEGEEFKEAFRREMYVEFRPDSPVKGCRMSGGGGGGGWGLSFTKSIRVIDEVSYRTRIINVADDGSVTMKAEILGVTLQVLGDSASVVFSTIDGSFNKSALSHDYSDVFRYLNETPFTVEITADGTVSSISGPIKEKIRKVKRNIPSNKVNGKSVTFFTDEILSVKYLQNALSMGWIHRAPAEIKNGTVQENVVETPPIPGEATAGAVSFEPMKRKRFTNNNPQTCLLSSRAGFGKNLNIGKAGIEVVEDTNMVKTVGMKIRQIQKGASFKMKYNRNTAN